MTSSPYADREPAPTLTEPDADRRSALAEPADFDVFWKETLDAARAVRPRLDRRPWPSPLRTVRVEDITFPGFAGQPIRGWLVRPAVDTGPLPLVIQYPGYGGGRGDPLAHLAWASCGYAHAVMDVRGQGDATPDRAVGATDGGFVVRGIETPAGYYYRRLVTDAVRAVECLRLHPSIDPARVSVAGGSQGGGLALAAAAFGDGIAGVLCDIPFMSDWRRGAQRADRGPYADVAALCRSGQLDVETVFSTLAYFDACHFAARGSAPALFSVALMDRVCPPSTVRAAYERYRGPKELVTWEFNDHEGGGLAQTARQLDFLAALG